MYKRILVGAWLALSVSLGGRACLASQAAEQTVTARFHIPDAYNVGTLLDASTPLRPPFRAELKYQFVLVEESVQEWVLLSHRAAEPNSQRFPAVRLERTPTGFALTLVGVEAEAISQAVFATMDEAVADYQRWLERAYGIGRIGQDQNKPAWLANVKLVFTVPSPVWCGVLCACRFGLQRPAAER